jgi:hypothetical protein
MLAPYMSWEVLFFYIHVAVKLDKIFLTTVVLNNCFSNSYTKRLYIISLCTSWKNNYLIHTYTVWKAATVVSFVRTVTRVVGPTYSAQCTAELNFHRMVEECTHDTDYNMLLTLAACSSQTSNNVPDFVYCVILIKSFKRLVCSTTLAVFTLFILCIYLQLMELPNYALNKIHAEANIKHKILILIF